MTKSVLTRIAAGFVAIVALLAAIFSAREFSMKATLRQNHATASGVVTSKKVGEHGAVDYLFSVAGKEYRATGIGGAQREFGAKVVVHYFPEDPSVSSLHDPLVWQSLDWPMIAVPIAIFCMSACIAAGLLKVPFRS
jgi:hypothetical protein